jgi:hypothetical protein
MYLRFLEMLQDSDLDPSRTCSEQRPETSEAVQMEPRITSTRVRDIRFMLFL